MRTALTVLNAVDVPHPCPVPWAEMAGGGGLRHCAHCDKKVHDLSALTAEEAVELLRAGEGQVCVQIYRRPDGTVLTADPRPTPRRRLWALASSVAAVVLFGGCEGPRPLDATQE